MEKAGFVIASVAGFLSVALLGWHGYRGPSADWVYGFLAFVWAGLMTVRVMMLTAPASRLPNVQSLAYRIINAYRVQQEVRRRSILDRSFNLSYGLFLLVILLFAAWQVYCALYPAANEAMESLSLSMRQFFVQSGVILSPAGAQFYDWGKGFLLLLSLCMMAFVLRSYTVERAMTRVVLIILCSYSVAGFIAFLGLSAANHDLIARPGMVGAGAGSLAYIAAGRSLSIIEIVLIESGVGGLLLLLALMLIPLIQICFRAQERHADALIVTCGIISGALMLASLFLSYNPAIGGYFALGWMAVFLAWGASERPAR